MTTADDQIAHCPRYLYCSEPELCCGTWHPIGVYCAVCDEKWPCTTKRSHHSEAQNARLARWAKGRPGRPAMSPGLRRRAAAVTLLKPGATRKRH